MSSKLAVKRCSSSPSFRQCALVSSCGRPCKCGCADQSAYYKLRDLSQHVIERLHIGMLTPYAISFWGFAKIVRGAAAVNAQIVCSRCRFGRQQIIRRCSLCGTRLGSAGARTQLSSRMSCKTCNQSPHSHQQLHNRPLYRVQMPPSNNNQRNDEAQKRQDDNGSFISRNLRRRVARRRAFRARLEVDRACCRKQRIPSQVEAATWVSRVLFRAQNSRTC